MRRVREENLKAKLLDMERQTAEREERSRTEQERAAEARQRLAEVKKEHLKQIVDSARQDAERLLKDKSVGASSRTVVTRDRMIKRSEVVKEIFESGESSQSANAIYDALARKKVVQSIHSD